MIDEILATARALADDVLFPRALETDVARLVPVDLLDRLADDGFYGMAAPADAGGWDLPIEDVQPVVETLAGGCLTTTFVWIQHHNVVRAVATTETAGLRDEWLVPLARGERRAGIALAGERPGPPLLLARAEGQELVLDGEAPWVTGWGRIDAVLVAARAGDRVVRVLVDAAASPTLTVVPLRLVAANASGTVVTRFDGHRVPASRIVGWEEHAAAMSRDATGLRTNGSLPLGVASRCLRLLGPSPLDDELVEIRAGLDGAGPQEMPAARARAAAFAWRAAGVLVATGGARSIVTDHHAQRLAREAMFTLVFGSRPPIKAALVERLVGG
ncbi:MAG TPA: acyl-CoA dehydrogenase family protein [Actinomycetota bacterium]